MVYLCYTFSIGEKAGCMKIVVLCLSVAVGVSVLVAGCSDDAVDDGGSVLSQASSSVTSAGSTSSVNSASVGSSSSQSVTVSSASSVSFGPLEPALVELFEDGVPPAGWTKLGVYSESQAGYSCGTNGLAAGTYGVKLSGSADDTSWLMTPDISVLGAVAVTFWYRGGAYYSGPDLGLRTEVSSDGSVFTQIGKESHATATYAQAGPYVVPAGTKHIRVWYLKHSSYNVTIDAFAIWKNR